MGPAPARRALVDTSHESHVATGAWRALSLERLPTPRPGPGQVLLKVEACAVCRTDLHVVDGELPGLRYPVTPGHEVIGIVEETGEGVDPRLAGRAPAPPGWPGLAAAARSA